MGWFQRSRPPVTDTGALGERVIALQLGAGDLAPVGSVVVIFNGGGYGRRSAPGRIAPAPGETVFCFHPGPYRCQLVPFAGAPELGLDLRFVIDAPDPRVSQQRFDLLLLSEAPRQLLLADFCAAAQSMLQQELAQGALLLPPCTSLAEWQAFRAGLDQLLYTRFGVTVEDCLPLDLGDRVDFAAILRQRAERLEQPAAAASIVPIAPIAPPASPAAAPAAEPDVAAADARALRRLFLELPAASGALRLIELPPGPALFQWQQQLLQRLGLLSIGVATMPSLGWSAPDQPLAPALQARRAAGSGAAVRALDEAWGLLARLQLAAPAELEAGFDQADRIIANLEHALALRRQPFPAQEPA